MMCVDLIARAAATPVKPPGRKFVFVMLAYHCRHGTDACWPSHKLLATECGMSEQMVRRHLADLMASGHVQRIGFQGHARLYQITPQPETTIAPCEMPEPETTVAGLEIATRNPGCANPKPQLREPETLVATNRKEQERTGNDIVDLGLENGSAQSPIAEAFGMFREAAEKFGLSVPRESALTDQRRRGIKARLKDCGGIEGWREALRMIGKSKFCRGGSDSGWKITLDSLLQPKTFTKLVECGYSNERMAFALKGNDRKDTGRRSGSAELTGADEFL